MDSIMGAKLSLALGLWMNTHLPIHPTVSVNDIGSDGSVTTQQLTPTEAQLTVNQKREATIEVVKHDARQAFSTFTDEFPTEAGRALMQDIDTKILALQSDVTQNVGDGAGNLGEDELLAAIQTLADLKIDVLENPMDHTFVFHTSQFPSLKKLKLVSDSAYRGKEGSAAEMFPNQVWGIPTYFSAVVASSGGERKNLLFKREAFAWGAQRNPSLEGPVSGLANGKLTTIWAIWALYGVKTVRANHAVVLRSKA